MKIQLENSTPHQFSPCEMRPISIKFNFVRSISKLIPATIDQCKDPGAREKRSCSVSMAPIKNLLGASFLPPVHPPPPPSDDAPRRHPSWLLLDVQAYISDGHHANATTAQAATRDGHPIRVTFCVALPPLVSHFCVHCPGLDPAAFALEPVIRAAEGPFTLLRVAICPMQSGHIRSGSETASPSPLLRLLPNPHPFYFSDHDVGLLPLPCAHEGGVGSCCAVVAATGTTSTCSTARRGNGAPGPSVDPPLPPPYTSFGCINKMITIGGEGGGSMGRVDLWRGILVCGDMLRKNPLLGFIKLPTPMIRSSSSSDLDPQESLRNIIAIGGLIRFFEKKIRPRSFGQDGNAIISQGWTATTWSTSSTKADDSWQWHKDCTFDVSDIAIYNERHLELLPSLQEDDNEEGTGQPTLKRLRTGVPALSLEDDGFVYLMTKVDRWDHTAWILAVDTRKKALQGVAEFGAERTLGLDYTYLQSSISQYLDTD
ncbi:uncharacterized protein LOC133923218 [Phragmites australis]|uniref:uncharacterized protein LOC133923218 n=1 Tax=Phragmites australis TaxID=29695 RepID=UPI002D775DF9|nr:uncharacterized protein LOC133923218 [Phragmites australis]